MVKKAGALLLSAAILWSLWGRWKTEYSPLTQWFSTDAAVETGDTAAVETGGGITAASESGEGATASAGTGTSEEKTAETEVGETEAVVTRITEAAEAGKSVTAATATGTDITAATATGDHTAQNTARIALTFDDGPHRGTTDRLLDGLKERGARATFFLVGEELSHYRDLAERMKAEGHQVGNHTWSHSRLDTLSSEELVQEVGKTDALLQSLLGPGVYYLRPPYGVLPETMPQMSVPIIRWSLDTRDWESRNTGKVMEAVLNDVQPGDIILLHDIYPSSVDAALALVDQLGQQGYQFVTVEELLAGSGILPVPGQVYRHGRTA